MKLITKSSWKYANGVYGPSSMMSIELFNSLMEGDELLAQSFADHLRNPGDQGFLTFIQAMAKNHKAAKVGEETKEDLLNSPRAELFRAIYVNVNLRPAITLLELLNAFDDLTPKLNYTAPNGRKVWVRGSKNMYPIYRNYLIKHGPIEKPEQWYDFLSHVLSRPEMKQTIDRVQLFINKWHQELTSAEFLENVDQLREELLTDLKSREESDERPQQSNQGQSLNSLINDLTSSLLAQYRPQFTGPRFGEEEIDNPRQSRFMTDRILRVDFVDPNESIANALDAAFYAEKRYYEEQ